MADSDNTTFVPSVIYSRVAERTPSEGRWPLAEDRRIAPSSDPVVALAQIWRVAHIKSLGLCERQQGLETAIVRQDFSAPDSPDVADWGTGFGASGAPSAYGAAKAAEEQAVEIADTLLDQLCTTSAETLAGVIAKLEAILARSEIEDSPGCFPWPHIRSVLADLKRHSASGSSGPHPNT